MSGLTLYNLARIAGEAGPFTDDHLKRGLLRYAGLNLRERHSGQYRGKTRLVTEVDVGRAGVVMGLEVSRLARNSTDWHRRPRSVRSVTR